MDFDNDSEFEFQRSHESVERFEQMLATNDQYYFDVDDLEELVDHYTMHRDFDKAWKVLDLAEKQHPHNSDFELSRVDLLFQQGQRDQAQEEIDKLIERSPSDLELRIFKGYMLSETEKRQEALDIYLQALTLTTNRSELYILASYEYKVLGNRTESFALLHKALEEDPESASVLYELGFAYESANMFDEGVKFITAYLEERPYSSDAWMVLHGLYNELGDKKMAIWALEFCAAIRDDDEFIALDLGFKYLEIKDYDRAETCFKDLVEDDVEDVYARMGLAECSEGRGHFNKAFKQYMKATEVNPLYADAWYSMALVRTKQKRFSEVLPYLTKALDLVPMHPLYLGLMGELETRAGNYEGALSAYQKATEADPSNIQHLISKAQVLFHHIDKTQGLEAMRSALTIDPENAEIHYRIAAFLLKFNRSGEAMPFIQNGLELDFSGHTVLFDEYPEAMNSSRVIDLIGIYGQ